MKRVHRLTSIRKVNFRLLRTYLMWTTLNFVILVDLRVVPRSANE
jgi:hypothetical protein